MRTSVEERAKTFNAITAANRASLCESRFHAGERSTHIPRPYVSPFGISGAAVTIAIALWTMTYQLRDPAYVKGAYAALAWYLGGVLYFVLVGRHRLVLSPEERFAITRGQSQAHD